MRSKSSAKKDLESLKYTKNVHIRQPRKTETKKPLTWWEIELEKLEKEVKTPDYKKWKCLKRIYSDKEIKDIANSGIDIQRVKSSPPELQNVNKTRRITFDVPRKSKSAPIRSTKYTNPYLEFMNKSFNDARIWHPKPECNLEDIPVMERADLLTEKVVDKFVKGFQSIAKASEVNENTLSSIFEMTCSHPISESCFTKTEIYGAVPETTAKHLGCPELGDNNKLIRQILRDIEASEKPVIKTAFGRSLPKELQRQPFKDHPGAKWAKKNEHKDLETFAEVWKNITDLESTRKFCLYLLEHPNVIPPPYLVDEGMLSRKVLRKPVYLGNYEKQLDTTSEMMDINAIINKVNQTMADFSRRLSKATEKSMSALSMGEISDINIMI